MLQLLLLLLRALFIGLRSRRDLALENLVLRHQLHVVLRTNPNPSLRNRDRVLWVWGAESPSGCRLGGIVLIEQAPRWGLLLVVLAPAPSVVGPHEMPAGAGRG